MRAAIEHWRSVAPVSAARAPDSPFAVSAWTARRRAFTLVEMVVVVAIILIVVVLIVPATSALWEQRKVADARNTIHGLLANARIRALQADGVETGLFFYLDDAGIQRVATIEQAEPDSVIWSGVFRITGDRDQVMPAPMRAVPRYIVEVPRNSTEYPDRFQDEEVQNNDFYNPPRDTDPAQRHRNYFTLIYSGRGELLVNRDVFIVDSDADRNDIGDRTGMFVGGDCLLTPGNDPLPIRQYYSRRDGIRPFDPASPTTERTDLLRACTAGNNPVAVNLFSVDGVLVYDDAAMNQLRINVPATDGREMRSYLQKNAQPFYIGRMTGSIIVGPVGNTQVGATP
jgi:prepilin-type N-terminal cleavage/methylation domain-containing protein